MTEKWGEIQWKLDLDRVLRVRVISVLLYDDREGLEDAVHMREKTRKVQREKSWLDGIPQKEVTEED